MNKASVLLIREATSKDAQGKGYVHYQSWIETYTGLFPDRVIENLSLERSILLAREHPENTFVAQMDERIVGFSCFMKSRDEDEPDAGEVVAIYVLKDFHRKGIGKKLLERCIEKLKEYPVIILWVLESNKASIAFYESQGFVFDNKKKIIYDQTAIRMKKELRTTQ